MASHTERYGCSPSFPVTYDESWTVRGIGGEPSERWTVTGVERDRNGAPHHFTVHIEEQS